MFEFVGLQGYQEALLDSDNYLGSGYAMDAFNATQTDVFYPECNAIITDADIEAYYSASPCPPGSNGTNCRLNWKRNKVNLPNVLETGVFGMPLRKFDPISPTGWKMVQNSSNFDLSLFLSRSIVRLLLKIDSREQFVAHARLQSTVKTTLCVTSVMLFLSTFSRTWK